MKMSSFQKFILKLFGLYNLVNNMILENQKLKEELNKVLNSSQMIKYSEDEEHYYATHV